MKSQAVRQTRNSYSRKPVIIVVDPSVNITGALVAANREAAALSEVADVILAIPKHSRAPRSAMGNFSKVIFLPPLYPRRTPLSLLKFPFHLLTSSVAILRETRLTDCRRIQLNDFYLLQGLILRLLGYKGRIHTWVRIQPSKVGLIGRLLIKLAAASSTRLVAVSECVERTLSQYNPDLIYDTFDPNALAIKRNEKATANFVYVANYTKGKGQDHAIRAFQRVGEQHPDAVLSFYGSNMGRTRNNDYKKELERLASVGPVASQFRFHDQILNPTTIYQDAFAALNLSDSESFSLTCLDASASGLAVIATRCGGPEEIIEDGATGLLVPTADIAAAAAGIDRLLTNPREALSMGQLGRLRAAERFAPTRLSASLISLWGLDNVVIDDLRN